MQRQRGVLGHIVKQVAITLFKGLSISYISLPIKIFEATSGLSRMVDLWTSAPVYLKRAGQTTDHLERLKLAVTFLISNLYMCCGQMKPFNPLLGETLQGEFADGTKYYMEHVSHHPPISSFLLEDPDGLWKMYGNYETYGKMEFNALISGLRGPMNLVFKDGQHIRFAVPFFKIHGLLYGTRTVELVGSVQFEDYTNNRKAVVCLNTLSKSGLLRRKTSGHVAGFTGLIYDCDPLVDSPEIIKKHYSKQQSFVSDVSKLSDVVTPLC